MLILAYVKKQCTISNPSDYFDSFDERMRLCLVHDIQVGSMRGIVANGGLVRQFRKQRGYTQEVLARRIGCDQRTVRNAESGKPIDAYVLYSLAECLETPVDSLVLRENGTVHIATTEDTKNVTEVNRSIVNRQLEGVIQSDVVSVCESLAADAVVEAPRFFCGSNNRIVGIKNIRSQMERLFSHFQIDVRGQLRLDVAGEWAFLRCQLLVTDRNQQRNEFRVFIEYKLIQAKVVFQSIVADFSPRAEFQADFFACSQPPF